LADEDYLIGINWTGTRLVGWEFTVDEVLNRLAHVWVKARTPTAEKLQRAVREIWSQAGPGFPPERRPGSC